MDWFSWLSNSGLDPGLVSEYSLLFSHNELEEEDIPQFNHEFLQSMGISIAKHRLEILKMARNRPADKAPPPPPPPQLPRQVAEALLAAFSRSKEWMAKHFLSFICDSSAIVVDPWPLKLHDGRSGSSRRSLAKRRRKQPVQLKRGRLMLANGGSAVKITERVAQGIRWESLFQDLKPT